MPDYFNIGAGYETGAWHEKMPVFNTPMIASEALEWAGMNFEYSLHPAYSEYPLAYDENGKPTEVHRIPVKNRFDMWREPIPSDPEPRLVRSGIGNRYKMIQHRDLGKILDPVSEKYPVETCAVVKDWQISFITLRMEDYEVGGIETEKTRTYLHVSDDRSGPGAAFWGITTVREVCYNTYMLAMSSAREMHRIPHNGDIHRELEFRRDLMVIAEKERTKALHQFEQMLRTPLTLDGLDSLLVSAFPYVAEPRELELARIIPAGASSKAINATRVVAQDKQDWMDKRNTTIGELRLEARGNFQKLNNEYSYAADTVYGGFQAITQTINHSDVYRGDKAKQMTNILIGDRGEAMDGAFKQAVALSKN
jgi:hypothetical protein